MAKESKLKSLKQMRKLFLVFLTANAFCFSGSPISAEDNPFGKTVPASVDIYDWYNIGESVNAMTTQRFNYSVYPNMDETYKDLSELLKKAHVSDATLRAFDDWYAILKSLPWDWKKDQEGVQFMIGGSAGDFLTFSTSSDYKTVFSTMKPEVQQAIIFIASMKKKLPDPNNPFKTAGQLTPDDVTKVVEAAKVIREAAQARQLTSD